MSLGLSIAQVAPLYNLGLVAIAIYFFVKLFTTPVRDRRVDLFPWKLLFFAVVIYIIEELLTFLRIIEVVNIPRHINGFFELFIIIIFIYALLLQKEHLKKVR